MISFKRKVLYIRKYKILDFSVRRRKVLDSRNKSGKKGKQIWTREYFYGKTESE